MARTEPVFSTDPVVSAVEFGEWLTLGDCDNGGVVDADPGSISGGLISPAAGQLRVTINPDGGGRNGYNEMASWDISATSGGWFDADEWPTDGSGIIMAQFKHVSLTGSAFPDPIGGICLVSKNNSAYGIGNGIEMSNLTQGNECRINATTSGVGSAYNTYGSTFGWWLPVVAETAQGFDVNMRNHAVGQDSAGNVRAGAAGISTLTTWPHDDYLDAANDMKLKVAFGNDTSNTTQYVWTFQVRIAIITRPLLSAA